MAIVLYRSDKVTELQGFAITNENAGADSDPVDFWVWNTGTTTARNVLLVQRTADPVNPSNRLASGVPPQDELWGRVKITGFDATGDATFRALLTDYIPMGAYGGLLVGDIPAGCGVGCRYLSHPPSDTDDLVPWTRSLRPIWDEYSQPMPAALGMVDRGIRTGIGDYTYNALLYGALDSESAGGFGSDGPTVVVWRSLWIAQGTLYGDVTRHPTLNQSDSASAALASGQLYWAAVSRGAGGAATVTKGVKGSSPAKPALPVGSVLVGYVKVRYQAGGTSAIATSDIDYTGVTQDRYAATNGGGLNLILSGGQAFGASTWRYAQASQTVPLTDASTCYVWQLASGRFTATTTAAPPELTALLFWTAVTAGGVITTITDRRIYAGYRSTILIADKLSTGGPADIATNMVADDRLVLERLIYRMSNNWGSSGLTKFDVLVNRAPAYTGAVTLYTSNATEDLRPTFAYNAASLVLDGFAGKTGTHEITDLYRGDILTFKSLTHPSGGGTTPAASVHLVCRKP